ncbi:zinc finger protein 486-like [Megalops cyprinoides]|uniref:zinc finger protein 486-like n=1 Tax=Megalops cyprinoides TaxID=118141 RepID=UPI001863F605|nr:zinc finger protein 486-like [Megalops cyprinoides]
MATVGGKAAKRAAAAAAVVRVREATAELILTAEPKGSPKHAGSAPFKCDKCNRSFSTGGQLTSHSCMKDRPYACTLCEKRFLTRSHLNEHQRVHTGERPYTCFQCVRSFTTMHNLKRHQTIHTKEQRYRCKTCGVLFCHVHKGAWTDGASPESTRSSPRQGLESSATSLPKSTLDHSTVKKKKAKRHAPSEVQVPCGGDGGGVVTLRRNAGGMQNKIAYDIEVVL